MNIDEKIEKLKYFLVYKLGNEFGQRMDDIEFSKHVFFTTDEIYTRIKGYVFAEKESVKRQEIKYPLDWWQAFKERWFGKLLLKRWPVLYKVVILDVRVLYPCYKPVLKNEVSCLSIHKTIHQIVED